MNTTINRDGRNWAMYVALAALCFSLISLLRQDLVRASWPEEREDLWKNVRHYPPLVFNSAAWLDCSISTTANGRQVMTTASGQGFTFDATMLPIKKSSLKLTNQSGMLYKFDAFPTAAIKARFSGLGEGMITEMKAEVEVAVSRFSQAGGPGTPIHFTAADIAPDSAYVEFTGVFVRASDNKPFPFRVLFGRVEEGNGTIIPNGTASETTLLSKAVSLGSRVRPATVITALYEAEEDVAKLRMP